jgi:hypothetical protein
MKQRICKSYLLASAQDEWGVDQMKLALYEGDTLDPDTLTAYTSDGETSGTGYAAGGFDLTLSDGFPKLATDAFKLLIDFEDIIVNPAQFTARCGLIYNASKDNRAIAVIDLGAIYTAANSFALIWPQPTDNNAIIRVGA